LKDLALDIEV